MAFALYQCKEISVRVRNMTFLLFASRSVAKVAKWELMKRRLKASVMAAARMSMCWPVGQSSAPRFYRASNHYARFQASTSSNDRRSAGGAWRPARNALAACNNQWRVSASNNIVRRSIVSSWQGLLRVCVYKPTQSLNSKPSRARYNIRKLSRGAPPMTALPPGVAWPRRCVRPCGEK